MKYILIIVVVYLLIYSLNIIFVSIETPKPLDTNEITDKIERIEKKQVESKQNIENTSDSFIKGDINMLIPKIDLEIALLTGDENVMNEGIWLKFPERYLSGAGNTVLTGHKFNIGVNPFGVSRKSPLMHLDKLIVGDQIYIIASGETEIYTVTEIFEVEPNDLWIEDNSEEEKLTLYTCTALGAQDGRDVVIAKRQ